MAVQALQAFHMDNLQLCTFIGKGAEWLLILVLLGIGRINAASRTCKSPRMGPHLAHPCEAIKCLLHATALGGAPGPCGLK